MKVEGHTEAVFITCGSITTCQFLINQNTSHSTKISLTDVDKAVVFYTGQGEGKGSVHK